MLSMWIHPYDREATDNPFTHPEEPVRGEPRSTEGGLYTGIGRLENVTMNAEAVGFQMCQLLGILRWVSDKGLKGACWTAAPRTLHQVEQQQPRIGGEWHPGHPKRSRD